jgi:hypothetical protein
VGAARDDVLAVAGEEVKRGRSLPEVLVTAVADEP